MSNRPPPPMYGRVPRKVPPTARPTPAPARASVPVVAVAVDPQSEAVAAPELVAEVPQKASKKGASKKTSKAPSRKTAPKKTVTWDEGMTQKALYQVAKKAGLDVRSKDWKHEIVAALKKAGI